VAANDYNLSVGSYVDGKDSREAVDIKLLNTKISGIVARQAELRKQLNFIVDELEGDRE
jgi:type I restriction enzyme M protein